MILKAFTSPIAFNLFGFQIYWYGIIMAIAIFTGIALTSYLLKRYVSDKDHTLFTDFAAYIVLFAVLGARLFYVIGSWEFYYNNPNEIFLINHGGLSIYGAIIFGIIAIFSLSKIYKFNMLKYCDVIATVFPLCQSIGRWGNFFNQEAYGRPYNGFLQLYIDEMHRKTNFQNIEYYHPAFLYESILDLALFILLIFIFLKCKNIKQGTIFLIYLFLYSIIRIIVESIRIDSVCFVFNIPVAMFISIITAVISAFILFIIYKNN